MQDTALDVTLCTDDGNKIAIPISGVKASPSGNLLDISLLKKQAAKIFKVSPWRVGVLDGLEQRFFSANEAVDLGSDRFQDGVEFQVIIHKGAEKSISIHSDTLGQVSSKSLLQSHINHLKEDLGIGKRWQSDRKFEVALVVTDWTNSMPSLIIDFLVEFLESRADDPNGMFLVHLDLHGKLQWILDAMIRNRAYYESVASSVETLEISLLEVDQESDFLPLFPNLSALRVYKPEFPEGAETNHYSVRLLDLNIDSLDDVAMVANDSTWHTFDNVLGRLAPMPQSGTSRIGSTLWMVGKLVDISTGLRKLGEHLASLRRRLDTDAALADNSFLLRLHKLNIHLEGEGSSDHIREIARAALNRGLSLEQQDKRRKVLTSIRTTAAQRNDDVLMCLFDVTPLSLGLATDNGTALFANEPTVATILMAKISAEIHSLHILCTSVAGNEVLSADLGVTSTVAELVGALSSKLGWTSAIVFLDHQYVDHAMSLRNYELLTIREVKNVTMTNIIPRNRVIPSRKVQTFTTSKDNQESVLIQVFEGERVFIKDNHLLGKFQLDGIPPAPRGHAKIQVVFDIDANGILKVSALEAKTGSHNEISITNEKGRLSQFGIDQMVKESYQFEAEEHELLTILAARTRLFNMCMELNRGDLGKEEDLTESNVVERTLSWLGDNPSAGKEEIEEMGRLLLNPNPKLAPPLNATDPAIEEVD